MLLVAITTAKGLSELATLFCKEYFLVLQQEKVVLGPRAALYPKVSSAFHLKEDIVLPSVCPTTLHQKEIL